MKRPTLVIGSTASLVLVVTLIAIAISGSGLSAAAQTANSTEVSDSKCDSTRPPATFLTLVNFDGANGDQPFTENLVQGKDGDLYGTTTYGGSGSDGIVFKVSTSGKITTLHNFVGIDGANPESGLVLGVDGNFYGTTNEGGLNGYGTVFKVTPGGTLTTLHSFDNTDGALPADALVQGSDKNFYGTTSSGAAPNIYGTVFKISSGGTFTSLVNFDKTNGYEPLAGLVQASNGNFYGTTASGGTSSLGTVFEISASGTLNSLYSFDNTHGWEPEAQLIQAADGNFYGTTLRGGANGDGEVFKITSSGTLTVLHSFDVTDGVEPNASVIQATDGNFYGTTFAGGTGEVGTVFEMNSAGKLKTLYNFTGITDGSAPFGGLVQHTSGGLYGVTGSGGTGRLGTVFAVSAGLKPFVKLLPASGKVGAHITILGTNLSGITNVLFNGTSASFTPGTTSYLTATVPAGATSGSVQVVTSSGTLTSNVPFQVTK